jgi:hypothetical protein
MPYAYPEGKFANPSIMLMLLDSVDRDGGRSRRRGPVRVLSPERLRTQPTPEPDR